MTSCAPHRIQFRAYYEDTDAGGIVYYANYLRFAERGRSEYLRAAGFENSLLQDKQGVMFIVRYLEADYLAPARLDDFLTVETIIDSVKNASFVMNQAVKCGDKLLFSMKVTLVCVDQDAKPVKLPEDLKGALERNG